MPDRTLPILLPGHSRTVRRGVVPSGSKWVADGIIYVGNDERVIIPYTEPPPPEPLTGLFIAPTGNDANAGTQVSPMKTILAASAKLTAGQTLWVRGGTYTGQGGYNWKSSGTAIRAYAGESPVFDGAGQSHGIIVSGFSNVTISGLAFTGYGMGPSGDGAILLLNSAGIVIEDCRFTNNGIGFQQDHHIYLNSGCRDITIRRNYFRQTPGAAVHIYHDPGPTNVAIEDNQMHDGYWGAVVGSNANGVRIDRNTFSGNIRDVDNQRGTNVTRDGAAV